MSYHVFFSMSAGFSPGMAMTVPEGTAEACRAHVADVERELGFEATRYKASAPTWGGMRVKDGVTDEVLCRVADDHNGWVRYLYKQLEEWSSADWSKPPKRGVKTEVLTSETGMTFWAGLHEIIVPPERWTRGYYRRRMEHLYNVMRGLESEGQTFAGEARTPKQAGAVIHAFEPFLGERHQLDLEVPNGLDELRSSYDGGYYWCTGCGPVAWEDWEDEEDEPSETCPGCRAKKKGAEEDA